MTYDSRGMAEETLLDQVGPESRELLLEAGSHRRFARGAFLFHEGEPARRVVLLQSGLVKIQTTAMDGRTSVLGFREGGALLGEQSTLDNEPMSASAVALSPTEAMVIPAKRFRDLLAENSDLSYAILLQMNRRLRASSRLIIELATADAVTRVANRLIDLASMDEDHPTRRIPVSQQDLADWAGLSREAVVRSLRTLREEGLIETGRMAVAVVDEGALRKRAFLHLQG